jgi:hypothetical protein
MAKVKLNPVLEQVHGKVGDLVFKKYQDGTIMARKPEVTQPNTPAQMAVRQNFRLAALYGKTVMADATKRAAYTAKAKQTGKPVFSLTIADFFNAPVVDEIDLSTYGGKPGDIIRVRAHDDFEVAGVQVQVRDTGGTILEQGAAALSATDGTWGYTATTTLAVNQQVVIEVDATDLPGHTGTKTQAR